MKPLQLILFSILWGLTSRAQNSTLRPKIDSLVTIINKTEGVVQKFRGARGDSFEIKLINNKLVKIIHSYQRSVSEMVETFYLKDTSLIFSTENENSYYLDTHWSGKFYFQKGVLKDYETLGHGKSEDDKWDPQKEILNSYKKNKTAVISYLKKKT